MRWIELTEKRRNPEVNVKKSTLEELMKYKGRDDVYVSFVSDVGVMSSFHNKHDGDDQYRAGVRAKGALTNVSGHKIGINPKSQFSTPNGIYCYPIEHIINVFKNESSDFATDRPFAYVIQSIGNLLIAPDYTEENLATDRAKLERLSTEEKMNHYVNNALVDTPAGKLWAITRGIAMEQGRTKERVSRGVINLHPNKWNKIFRDLGYSGFSDIKGERIIHDNEPTQCVFFARNAFKVLETIVNRPPEDTSWIHKPKVLVKKINSGEFSDEKSAELLYWNAEGFKTEMLRDLELSEGVVRILKEKMLDESNIKNVPKWLFNYLRVNSLLTEDEIISVITNDAHLVRIYGSRDNAWQIGMTPKVENTMISLMVQSPQLYLSKSNLIYFMSDGKLSDEQLVTIINRDPHALTSLNPGVIPQNVFKILGETNPKKFIPIFRAEIIPYVDDAILSEFVSTLTNISYNHFDKYGPLTIKALIKKAPNYVLGAISQGYFKKFTPEIKKDIAQVGMSYMGLFIVNIGEISKKDALDIISMMPKHEAETISQFKVAALEPFKNALLARAK